MFCLERTSPGLRGSAGEKAWFERKVYSLKKKIRSINHCNTIYLKIFSNCLPGTLHHSGYTQSLGVSLVSKEAATQ